MIIVIGLYVKDLNNFLNYVKAKGCNVAEGPHSVLLDDSEVGCWYILKNSKIIGEIVVHYIDSHYEYLKTLPPQASDQDIIRALLEAEKQGLWRVPVEPVIAVFYEEDVILRDILRYRDEYPDEKTKFWFEKYSTNSSPYKNFIMSSLSTRISILGKRW